MDIRPLEATRDAWVWRQSRFMVKAVYRLLCGQLSPENVYVTQRCKLIWKRHIPLKIRIFGWLLLRRRLMTRVARQGMFPDSPVCCPLCGGGPEDCSHLFFQCPLAQVAWRGAGGGGGPTLRDLGGEVLERRIGGESSPLCGRFGSTGTRSSSGTSPRPEMPLHIQLRDFIFLGTQVALTPLTLYPCCDRPCCCTIWGHR